VLVGYARVSTRDQSLDLQLDALRAAGCGRVFADEASGARPDRPGLAQALSHLRDGDTLWRRWYEHAAGCPFRYCQVFTRP
jgi:DNA invertase Pin-like site-specific DNA recombinase